MLTDERTTRMGRPRDPGVEHSILIATQELLVANGYAGTTIAAVASRARCGKSAIYRRWGTKADLVVAAVLATQQRREIPDTGDLRADLLAACMHFADTGDRSGIVLASVLSEIGRDPELHKAAQDKIGGPPVAAIEKVIERWMSRGRISPDAPVRLVASIVPTAAFGNITLHQRGLDASDIVDLVDHIMLPALRERPE